MSEVKIATKDRLEESKMRLSKAFKHLELLVDQKLDTQLSIRKEDNKNIEEVSTLKNEIMALELKNKALSDEYNKVKIHLNDTKKVSSEVLEEIYQTIDTLEGLLRQNGDS